MNKEMKKAAAMIEEKKKIQAETIAAAEQAINEKQAKLESLKEQLATTQEEETYTKLCQEIRDTESAIEFHKKRKSDAERKGVITPEEYKAIVAKIAEAHASLNGDPAGEIQAITQKAFTLIALRDKEFTELNDIIAQLRSIYPGTTLLPYNAGMFPGDNAQVKALIAAYYRLHALEIAMQPAGIQAKAGAKK